MRVKLFVAFFLGFGFLCGICFADRVYWDDTYVNADAMDRVDDDYSGDWGIVYQDEFAGFCRGIIWFLSKAEENGDIDHQGPIFGYYATQTAAYGNDTGISN